VSGLLLPSSRRATRPASPCSTGRGASSARPSPARSRCTRGAAGSSPSSPRGPTCAGSTRPRRGPGCDRGEPRRHRLHCRHGGPGAGRLPPRGPLVREGTRLVARRPLRRRQPPRGSPLRRLAAGSRGTRASGAALPAGGPRRLRRPHLPRRDARPPRLSPPRRDGRRRRRRGLRQGGAPARPRLSGGPGDRERGLGRPRPARAASTGLARRLVRLQLLGPQDGAPAARGGGTRRLGLPPAEEGGRLPGPRVAALAAAFQESIVDVLATKALRAAEATAARAVVVGGGVASNESLRERLAAGAPPSRPRAGGAAGRPVHRQRGDDRSGRGPSPGRRRAGGAGPGARPSWPLARPTGAPETRATAPPRRGGAGIRRHRDAEADAAGRQAP